MVQIFKPICCMNSQNPCYAKAQKLFVEILPLLSALGDSTRQQLILCMISKEPKTVHELADALKLSRPAVSHHIKILKQASLLEERKEGTKHYYLPVLCRHIAPLQELINLAHQMSDYEKKEGENGKLLAQDR